MISFVSPINAVFVIAAAIMAPPFAAWLREPAALSLPAEQVDA
ncbi:hypothetical protein [Streptosporangium jomthongense]|uniref:Uncharacterized protein n=1 Tax=Streptosporangium jomthongense TaxID=1193683 RepID=A0ABV8FDG5_9ACTN